MKGAERGGIARRGGPILPSLLILASTYFSFFFLHLFLSLLGFDLFFSSISLQDVLYHMEDSWTWMTWIYLENVYLNLYDTYWYLCSFYWQSMVMWLVRIISATWHRWHGEGGGDDLHQGVEPAIPKAVGCHVPHATVTVEANDVRCRNWCETHFGSFLLWDTLLISTHTTQPEISEMWDEPEVVYRIALRTFCHLNLLSRSNLKTFQNDTQHSLEILSFDRNSKPPAESLLASWYKP